MKKKQLKVSSKRKFIITFALMDLVEFSPSY